MWFSIAFSVLYQMINNLSVFCVRTVYIYSQNSAMDRDLLSLNAAAHVHRLVDPYGGVERTNKVHVLCEIAKKHASLHNDALLPSSSAAANNTSPNKFSSAKI